MTTELANISDVTVEDMKIEHQIFVQEYIFDWNATRAYRVAYPKGKKSENTVAVNASRLLKDAKIQAYIKHIQKNIEKNVGISREMVLAEHMKLAFSSIAHLHNTWIDRKQFDDLTDQQKSCIAEIHTRVKKVPTMTGDGPVFVEVEEIRLKLYDKQKALDAISKMLGYNEPDKINLSGGITVTPKQWVGDEDS